MATRVARSQVRRFATSVQVATATVGRGTVTDSNTGHRCTSGTELHVEVIGEFRIVTGGTPVQAGSTQAPGANDVRAVLVTADPASGLPCLVSVQTGTVRRDPHATVLFTH